jgi:hypothetical protein
MNARTRSLGRSRRPYLADRPARRVAGLLGAATCLALAGCGAGGAATATSIPAAAPPEPTTQQTTQTPTTTAATTPASSAVSTWKVRITPPGGYIYGATIALGAPQHFSSSDVPQCSQGDPQTDAEISGTLTLTNDTPNFPGQPGIDIEVVADPLPNAVIADPNDCLPISGNIPAIAFLANGQVPQGQPISEHIWVVVPNYFSPNDPNGNPSLLTNVLLQSFYYGANGTDSSVHVTVSGPNVGDGGIFSLQSLASS